MICTRSARRSIRVLRVAASVLLAGSLSAQAEPIKVRHPQGSAHGFVDVTTLEGTRIAVGDLLQRTHGNTVSSRLILHFFDGSLDDETTLFSQQGVFRFISDHHVQKGPSFPKPVDTTIDAETGLVTFTDSKGEVRSVHADMPPDVYNGLASTMLMNLPKNAPATTISVVIAADKPRTVHLVMTQGEEVPFMLGGTPRKAVDHVVHIELGGVAGVVAPLIGKQPADYHVLLLTGEDPAFIREEGQLYEGGPVWRIQQISATFPR